MSKPKEGIRIEALKVETGLLEVRPVARCRDEERRAACCGHALFVDLSEATRTVEEADLVTPRLAPYRHSADACFDPHAAQEGNFPPGYSAGAHLLASPVSIPIYQRCSIARACSGVNG